jgi:hypothetical protein
MPARMKGVILALLCALVVAGCESVSSDSIARWKTTQKGPAKLEEAVKDSAVPANLRAEAAAALVDIGMADEADRALGTVPAGARGELVKALVPLYIAQMKAPSLPKARAARDALFGVRMLSAPEDQRQIDAALLPSIEADLRAGRVSGGRQSLDKILAAIGPGSAPMLVSLLEDPRVPYEGVVESLDRVADPAARERGGAALVKRATASPQIPVALWRALGTLGGRTASAFLMQKAAGNSPQDALSAVQALEQRHEPSVLPLALGMAGDQKADKGVREEMFGLVEKIGGPEAQRGLLRIIAADPNPTVRYLAYEAALAMGGPDAILPALEALPAKAAYKREDVVDYLVKDIAKIGRPARPALARALASPSVLARMTAVLALESALAADPRKNLAGAADAPGVLKLSGDKGTVGGFPPGDTVGKEAARVGAVLQKRVGS